MSTRLVPFLLLLAMLANLAAPLVQRLAGEPVEAFEEKAGEEGKAAKELEKKAVDLLDHVFPNTFQAPADDDRANRLGRHADDRAPSNRFALTPEQPPEA